MTMNLLLIVNDPPYGSERCYNALRLAHALVKKDADARIVIFLMADAVLSAKAGQKTPEGFYGIERMLKRVMASGGKVLLCGTCMDARGLGEAELMEGAPQHDGRTRRRNPRRRQGARVLSPEPAT
jgi:uncharacterized protein involved in oxidation of intracellular sulfur